MNLNQKIFNLKKIIKYKYLIVKIIFHQKILKFNHNNKLKNQPIVI